MAERKVLLRFEVDTSGNIRKVEKFNRSIKNTGDVAEKSSKKAREAARKHAEAVRKTAEEIRKLGGAFALVSLGAGVLAKQFFDAGISAVKTGAMFETLGIQMNTAFQGNAQAAQEAMDWVRQFTKDTPIQLQDSIETFIQLRQSGIEPMAGAMQAIVDASSKAGGGQERLQSITSALTKAYTIGKLSMEEMRMMMERQVPVIRLLADRLGVTEQKITEMSAAGKLNREVIDELIVGMSEWAGGASAALMDSMSGKWVNLADVFAEAQNSFAQGLMPALKGGLDELISSINDMVASGKIESFGKAVGDTLSVLVLAVKTVKDEIDSMGAAMDALSISFGQSGQIFNFIGAAILKFGKDVGQTINDVSTGLTLFVIGIEQIKVAWNTAIVGILMGSQLLSNEMSKLWDKFGESIVESMETIRAMLVLIDAMPFGLSTSEKAFEAIDLAIASLAKSTEGARKNIVDLSPVVGIFTQRANESKAAIDRLSAGLNKSGESAKETEKPMSALAQSIQGQIDDLKALAKQRDKTNAVLKKTTDEVKKLADEESTLNEIIKNREELQETQIDHMDMVGGALENLKGLFEDLVSSEETLSGKISGTVEWLGLLGKSMTTAADGTTDLKQGIERLLGSMGLLSSGGGNKLKIDVEIEAPDIERQLSPMLQSISQSVTTTFTNSLLLITSGASGDEIRAAWLGMFQDIAGSAMDEFQGFLSQALSGEITIGEGDQQRRAGFFEALFGTEGGKQAMGQLGLSLGASMMMTAIEEGDALGGVIGGAMAGAAIAGPWGAVAGAIVGGISAWMGDADKVPRVGFNIRPGGANVRVLDQGDLTFEEIEVLRAQIFTSYRNMALTMRDILKIFRDPEILAAFRLPTIGVEADEFQSIFVEGIEGELNSVLDWLFNVGLPDAFQAAAADLIRGGLANLGFADVATDILLDELGALPTEDRLEALANFLNTIVSITSIIEEGTFDAIAAQTFENSTQAFVRGITEVSDQITIITAGIDQLSLIDRATEIADVVALFNQAGQGLQRFIQNLQRVRDSIDQMLGQSMRQLELGGMTPEEQIRFLESETSDLMQILETGIDPTTGLALTPEDVQRIASQINQNINAMAGLWDTLGKLDLQDPTGITPRQSLIEMLQNVQDLTTMRLDEIEVEGREVWQNLYDQIVDVAGALGLMLTSTDDLTEWLNNIPTFDADPVGSRPLEDIEEDVKIDTTGDVIVNTPITPGGGPKATGQSIVTPMGTVSPAGGGSGTDMNITLTLNASGLPGLLTVEDVSAMIANGINAYDANRNQPAAGSV